MAASKYGSNRSEVVRLAIADGLRGAVEDLERLREVRLLEAAGAGAARVWKGRGAPQRSAGGSREPLDPDRAVSALLEYGRAVRASDVDLDPQQLRNGLQMHAHVIAVAELGISRSWIIRECIAEGFARVVEKVRERRRAGLIPRGEYQHPNAVSPRRGPRSDGSRADRWVGAPVRRERD